MFVNVVALSQTHPSEESFRQVLINCYNLLLCKRDGSAQFWEETKERVHEKFDFMLTPEELDEVPQELTISKSSDAGVLATGVGRRATAHSVPPPR